MRGIGREFEVREAVARPGLRRRVMARAATPAAWQGWRLLGLAAALGLAVAALGTALGAAL